MELSAPLFTMTLAEIMQVSFILFFIWFQITFAIIAKGLHEDITMMRELEYVEHDDHYITVTDAQGSIHHIMKEFAENTSIKKFKPGDKIYFDLSEQYVQANSLVEF